MAKERLKSPRTRLFVALDIPEEVRDEIAAWQRRELIDEALRVTPAENLHVTLTFLGWQRERDIAAIAELVALDAVGSTARLRLERDPVASPRARKRPRLYALDAPSEGATRLYLALSERLEVAGFYRPERRSFWSHLTVARVRPEKRGSKRLRKVARPPGPLPEQLTAHAFDAVRVSLYRSVLRPQGAEYTLLAQTELPREAPDAAAKR